MREQYLLQDMSNNYCHTTSFTTSVNTTITAIPNSYKKFDYTTELNLELYETTFMGNPCHQHL